MEIKVVTPDMAQDIIDYVKKASGETDNIITTPEEFTLTEEQEAKYIQAVLDSRLSNMIVMMEDGQIIGQCGLHGREGRKRLGHISSLGITILKEHWNKGIGYKLMSTQIEYAKSHGISKINLEVRTDNPAAVHLYKKIGFEIEGTNRRSMYVEGEYIDTYYMGMII
jgi:RimJ/RimL family protein N-acetyltransferase